VEAPPAKSSSAKFIAVGAVIAVLVGVGLFLFRPGGKTVEQLSVSPQTVDWGEVAGGKLPSTNIMVNGLGLDFTVESSDPSIKVEPDKGHAPAVVQISLAPGQQKAGDHNPQVTVRGTLPDQAALVIPIRFHITPPASILRVAPTRIKVEYKILSGSQLGNESLRLTATGSPLNVSARVTKGNGWLSVKGGGQTPAVIQVSFKLAGLRLGEYQGEILCVADGQQFTVPVELTIRTPFDAK
jgi:hypothetical protein